MKPSSRHARVAIAALILISSSASAGTLRYTWRKGEVQRYRYEATSHFHRGGLTVGIRSTFSQKVRAVSRDGTAQVEVTLEKLQVLLGEKVMDVLRELPPQATTTTGTLDRAGRLTVERGPVLSLHEGRIEAHPRAPQADSDGAADADPTLDALPCRVFDLVTLPPRAPVVGQTREVRGPAGAVRWSLGRNERSVSTMRISTAAASDDRQARRRMASSTRETLVARREADLTVRFDRVARRLLEARGTVIEWTPNKTSSTFVLTLLR
jgi:hypothetical protein